MRARFKRVALGLLMLGAACAALLALTVLLLVEGVERERIASEVERRIAERLGARVEIGALDGPLYPSAELRDLRVTWPEGTLQVPRLSIRYALPSLLGRTRLRIEALAIERPSLELRALPELPASTPNEGGPEIELAALDVRGAEVRWLGAGPGALSARMQLSARDWRLGAAPTLPGRAALRASASLELARADGPDAPTRTLTLASELELAGSELRIHRLALDGGAGHLASRGHATLDASGVRTLALDARAAGLDLAPLLSMPGLRTALDGSIEVSAERAARDSWRETRGRARASLRGSAAGLAIQSIDVEASAARGTLEIARADVAGPALELHAQGSFTHRVAFRVHGALPDLSRLQIPSVPLSRAKGALDFDGEIRGPRDALEGQFALRGRRLAFATRVLGELDARIRLRGTALEIERARLEHGAERLELAGRLDLSEPREPRAQELRIDLARVDLGSLQRAFAAGPELRGRLSGRASLRGTLREPRAQAALRIDSARVERWAADRLEIELDVAERWRGRLLAHLEGKQGSAELRVDLPPPPDTDLRERWKPWLATPEASLTLEAKRVDVALAAPFLPQSVSAASGRVDLELQAAGGWPPTTLAGHARVEDLSLALGAPGRSFGPARGTLELGPRARATGSVPFRAELDLPDAWRGHAAGRLQLRPDPLATRLELTDLRLERQRSVVTLSGVLERGEVDPLRVEVESLDVAALPALEGVEQLGGRLDAQFLMRGALRRPLLSGAAVWEEPRVGPARAERATLEWSTNDGQLIGAARIIERGAVVASAQLRAPALSGAAPYAKLLARHGAELKLDASDLDVALLSPFVSGFARDVRGRIELHAEASGDPWKPRLAGRLALREGSMRIPALGQTFAPIEAVLVAQEDAIRIEKLSLASADGGSASLGGEIGLAALVPKTLDARIQLERLGVMRAGGTRVNVDGSVSVAGPFDALRFEGDLALHESRFGVPQQDDPLAREIRILRSSSDPAALLRDEPSEVQLWVRRSSGTLRLQVPSNTWIRGAGAELELAGAVELRKQPLEEPRFFGALDVVRGEYRFASRTLEVESGRATFTGSSLLDPQLDVRVTTEVDEYRVALLLSGPLSNPNLLPTSDPPLPRNDVLALLLFGSRSRDAGPEKALALDLALAQLGKDLAADQLSARISSHLPFDTFRVGVAEDGSGATLEVGRYLRKDVFVRYEQTLGAKASDTIVVEWRFTPTLRIESSTSTRTGTGADLIWRKDY